MAIAVRRNRSRREGSNRPLSERKPLVFDELVLRSDRIDEGSVSLWVASSPAGKMTQPVTVAASPAVLRSLDVPFRAPIERAVEVGRNLAEVLLPEPVYLLVRESVRRLDDSHGLRIRLDLDSSLIDLPFEFVVRPEVKRVRDLSAFLFLDPKISLVRGAGDRTARLAASGEPQRLLFLGTFWPGKRDGWKVREEFDKLRGATKPVAGFLSMEFRDVAEVRAVHEELDRGASIVHYSGHSSIDQLGNYLARVGDEPDYAPGWHAEDFAAAVSDAGARMVVLSACNSSAYGMVEPLLRRGIPAVIGMFGDVESHSATIYCERLYAALAVGLSIDEAATYARLHVARAGTLPCDWGMPMVYLATRQAVIFPRPDTRGVRDHQVHQREARATTVQDFRNSLAAIDDDALAGIVISELAQKQVLILGRFKANRKAVLDALRTALKRFPAGYRPTVFDFAVPEGRRLGESVLTMAGLSRFVIADLTDPASIPAELEKIVPQCRSLAVQPILLEGKKPYALFENLADLPNMLEIVYYRDQKNLLARLERDVVTPAEARATRLRSKKPAPG